MTGCQGVVSRLTAWAAGALTAEDAALIREHLEGCPDCRAAAASEASLARGVARATAEPGTASHVRSLLGQARERLGQESPPRARPRRWRRVLLAAVLLLASGTGLMIGLGPPCLRGDCPTMHMLLDAVALSGSPEAQGAPVDLGVPSLPGLRPIGAGEVTGMSGPVPVAFFAHDGTQLVVFRSPDAHTHFWQVERLADGREYVDRTVQGRNVVGWVDETGRVWGCFGTDRAKALALALDLRQRTS